MPSRCFQTSRVLQSVATMFVVNSLLVEIHDNFQACTMIAESRLPAAHLSKLKCSTHECAHRLPVKLASWPRTVLVDPWICLHSAARMLQGRQRLQTRQTNLPSVFHATQMPSWATIQLQSVGSASLAVVAAPRTQPVPVHHSKSKVPHMCAKDERIGLVLSGLP